MVIRRGTSKSTIQGGFKKLSQFANAAVFDKETGLVWEKSPDGVNTRTWFNALVHCYQRQVGGRKGWRLATIEELASLVDTSQPAPTLPASNPFINVQSSAYWSATTDASDSGLAWFVFLDSGSVRSGDKPVDCFVWCVRGGQGADTQ